MQLRQAGFVTKHVLPLDDRACFHRSRLAGLAPTRDRRQRCPTQAPGDGGTPEWTLSGATGSVGVTGSTDTAAPRVTVTTPFSVSETAVHTLRAGDGPVVAPTATVSVCYMGVNGRDGKVFDSAYERGTPAQFPLNGVVPGFQKAISGQKVGSTVGVAMAQRTATPTVSPKRGSRRATA